MMHLYTISKGTAGIVIDQTGKQPIQQDWVTRRDLAFTDFVIDPIWYHNARGTSPFAGWLNDLAQRGYIVFGGESGSAVNADYLLAVPYDQVVVR